jgi:hypothetical protein
MTKLFFVTCCLICCMLQSCTYESVEPAKIVVTDSVISYSKVIAPLTAAQCSSSTGCHESGSQDGDFTTYAGLNEKAMDGTLYNRVFKVKDMPQIGSAYKLTDEQRGFYAAWIAQGAPNN